VINGGHGGGGGGGEVMVVHGGRDKAGPLDDLHLFRFGALHLDLFPCNVTRPTTLY
jgi:hypothetical protein